MKILFIAGGSDPRTLGGIETFGRKIKNFFPREVKFITYKTNKKKYFKVEDVKEIHSTNIFIKILNKLFRNKIKIFFLKKEVEKNNPDICIINKPEEIYALNNKMKKILIQHRCFDNYILTYLGKNRKLIEYLKKNLDYFVFLSEYDRERFIKELGFSEGKTIAIRHSCEMEILNKNKIKNKNLIMIARLENNIKRFDLPIKAMKKLPDFTLNIYGDGRDKKKLENLIKKENLKNVILHGGTNQIKEKLDENSVFIMTSDFEGYGITNIEAMRRGLPLIVRNTFEAAQDIVIDNGILLEKEWNEDKFIETIRKIYDNYEYYSQNAIKQGKRYESKPIKEKWKELINNL